MKQVSRVSPKVAVLLFNTDAKNGVFWGNLSLSFFAGQLKSLKIDYTLFVLLMKPADIKQNQETINKSLNLLVRGKFDTIIMHSSWLPWLPQTLRQRTGAKVFCLDYSDKQDIPDQLNLMGLPPVQTVLAALLNTKFESIQEVIKKFKRLTTFNPQFNYTFVGLPPGSQTLPKQEKVDVSLRVPCPFHQDVRLNPRFKGICFDEGISTQGCSYCVAAKASLNRPMAEDKKRKQMVEQVRYLQNHLPSLKEIAVVYPELYLRVLPWIMRNSKRLGIKPITFSGQFRAAVLARHESDIRVLLKTALKTGFRFEMCVVGLESFCNQDLMLFNRGSVREVRQAVKVIERLRDSFDPGFFMPATVGSFILFHPWQTVAGLRENIRSFLSEGIHGLFPKLNFNDIRINKDVALYKLAEAQNCLSSQAGRNINDIPLGGYFTEHPWVFKDKKTKHIHALYTSLAPKVTERIGLLEALCDYAEKSRLNSESSDGKKIVPLLEGLYSLLLRYYWQKDSEGVPVYVGDTCNSSCQYCVYEHARFIKGKPLAIKNAHAAFLKNKQVVTIAGREPTLLPWLIPFIRGLKKKNPRRIQLVTNARRCVYPHYAGSLLRAGVSDFLIKFFSWQPKVHDQLTRCPGSFRQSVAGIGELKRSAQSLAIPVQIALLVVVSDAVINELHETILFAQRIGADEVRFVYPMSAVNLAGLKDSARKLEAILSQRRDPRLCVGTDPRFSFSMTV
ncbi:MAG: radical SAM protein [Candidatus Omnitrophota bacterium]|jgi:hypothetical protein